MTCKKWNCVFFFAYLVCSGCGTVLYGRTPQSGDLSVAQRVAIPVQATGRNDGPVVMATVLRVSGETSLGLNAHLAALRPTKGKLLVSTIATGESAADFTIRFSWRSPKDARSSGEVPSMLAADSEPARQAILAAMTGSYSERTMARVAIERPSNGTNKSWEVIFPSPHSGLSLARQFRLARRLVAARLVDMKMMSPLAGTWPPEFRPKKALALYDAEGVGYYGSTLLGRAVAETTLDAQTVAVCPEDIREGILDRCIGVLFPGGSGRGIAVALHPDGVQRVRDFVAKGGGYFGVCAGAYLAASGCPEYTGMMPLKHGQPWAKGHGLLKLELTPQGAALLGAEFSCIETSYNCGPVFPDLAPNGRRAPVSVLAKFESPVTDKKGTVHEEMVGTPAIMSMQWQKGRIMIISPHPEGNSKFYPLVARAIGWTIGQDPTSVHARVSSSPGGETRSKRRRFEPSTEKGRKK